MAKADETQEQLNSFDLEAQKKPRKSTLKKQLKIADSILSATQGQSVVNEFDRIKIWIDLRIHAEHIEFEILSLDETKYPSLNPYQRIYNEDRDRKYKFKDNENSEDDSLNGYIDIDNPEDYNYDDLDYFEDSRENDSDWAEFEEKIAEIRAERQDKRNKEILEHKVEYNFLKNDYAIDFDLYRKTIGLNNLYIQHGRLVIDITGKFMANVGYLGKIDRDNIRGCIQRILDLHVISFDIAKFLEVARVYSLDVCVDIPYENSEKVKTVIEGTSSLLPITTSSCRIYKYRRTGLLLTKKAKNNGEALTLYHKGEELSYRNSAEYQRTIGSIGVGLAQRTLRIEYKLYKFENIRESLKIKSTEDNNILLNDVLNSQEKPILKAFEQFEAEPNQLKERIYGWIETEANIDTGISETSLFEVLLAERYIELLKENNYDIIRTRNHIKTEYSGLVSEDTIKKFNSLANSRTLILNFLIYRKPKSITIVLELLAKIYEYYGMELGGTSD